MRKLFVFSSSRNVRDFYASNQNTDFILDKAITIGEFESNVLMVKGLKRASRTKEILTMKKAALMVEGLHEKLKIPTEFFAFLKNSDYLFAFLTELKKERVNIEDIKFSDVYANYDEHLEILRQLEICYLNLLKKDGFYDGISVCDQFSVNEDYLINFDLIIFHIDGILSNFEWEILIQISRITQVVIRFISSKFNQKLISKIRKITSLDISGYFEYEIDLTKNTIISKKELKTCGDIVVKPFLQRSLQAVYIFDEVSKFVRLGLSAQKIAVVLPDEEFAVVLENLDERKMLNYAMGKSFKKQNIYILLNTLKDAFYNNLSYDEFISKSENPHDAYIKESNNLNDKICTLNYYNFSFSLYQNIHEMYNLECDFTAFSRSMQTIFSTMSFTQEVSEILQTELFLLQQLFIGEKVKFSDLFELFLMNLAEKKISSVGGGEVSVLGLLESRSKAYDAVIIVDFNDNLVPKPSQKEMFLSSQVRQSAGLISHTDRTNLQRFYYESLINQAKHVRISYVSDEDSILSRFSEDFSYRVDLDCSEDDYLDAISNSDLKLNLSEDKIGCWYDFFEYPISFSMINEFNKCPRSYYYKYIKKLSGIRKFDCAIDARETGVMMHESLKLYFKDNKNKFDENEFLNYIPLNFKQKNPLDFEVLKLNLSEFAKWQNALFNSGFIVQECEKELVNTFCGVMIKGVIDRIDFRPSDGASMLIDYKFAKSNQTVINSFQLTFYRALYGGFGSEFYYFFGDNLALCNKEDNQVELEKIIQNMKNQTKQFMYFDKKVGSHCQFCDYRLVCLKEVK